MTRPCPVVHALLLTLALAAGAWGAPGGALRDEASARSDALVKQGYNFTHGFSFGPLAQRTVERFEFLIPETEAHAFTLWAASAEAPVSARLLGPDGAVRAAFTGTRGELTVSFEAPLGKYVLELERAPNAAAEALLGIKGPALHHCEPRGTVQVQERVANEAKGFRWPYLLAVPTRVTAQHLLVRPNNTGFATEEPELLRASASCELAQVSALAERLGTPLLVPLFPRPRGETEDLYLHALTRDALMATAPAHRRVDLQLLAMIDDAREALAAKGAPVKDTVLLWGFSASGSFVDRFAKLHPERVLAAAIGSPGGWPLAPARTDGPDALPYPVGLAGVEGLSWVNLDLPALRKVHFLYFLGDRDENDAVTHRDSFTKADEALIFRRFGPTPVARWKTAQRLASGAGLDARFKLYPGAGHALTPAMASDLEAFFSEVLAKQKP